MKQLNEKMKEMITILRRSKLLDKFSLSVQ